MYSLFLTVRQRMSRCKKFLHTFILILDVATVQGIFRCNKLVVPVGIRRYIFGGSKTCSGRSFLSSRLSKSMRVCININHFLHHLGRISLFFK